MQGALTNFAWLNDGLNTATACRLSMHWSDKNEMNRALGHLCALVRHADNTSIGIVTLHKQIRP